MRRLIMTAVTMLSITAPALASDGIQLGNPSYAGNGCPAGSASVTLSPDNTAMSILFDKYQVEAGGMTGKRIDRKNCSVAVPVIIPQGFSVSVFSVDYRGFNSLPDGASSTFSAEYFLAGAQGPKYAETFQGPQDQDYTISHQLNAAHLVWSACGKQVILRANAACE